MGEIVPFKDRCPAMVQRGIDETIYNALKTSIYPGAQDESIAMVLDYCNARQLDPMMKPVHIVPMSVKVGNNYEMRDVVMPGINTYRIQADRTRCLAGIDRPIFGQDITGKLGTIDITYPEWCEVTVWKLVGGHKVPFVAREYFLEAYATKKRNDLTPNAMWAKRPRGQLAKCAEALALRKGFPEIGQQPTYEEMVGKSVIKDITPDDSMSLLEAASGSVVDIHINRIKSAKDLDELKQMFGVGYTELKQSGDKQGMTKLQGEYEIVKGKFNG